MEILLQPRFVIQIKLDSAVFDDNVSLQVLNLTSLLPLLDGVEILDLLSESLIFELNCINVLEQWIVLHNPRGHLSLVNREPLDFLPDQPQFLLLLLQLLQVLLVGNLLFLELGLKGEPLSLTVSELFPRLNLLLIF